MVINTPLGKRSRFDETAIRREARALDIPCITTLSGGRAAVDGVRAMQRGLQGVVSLQQLHGPKQIPTNDGLSPTKTR